MKQNNNLNLSWNMVIIDAKRNPTTGQAPKLLQLGTDNNFNLRHSQFLFAQIFVTLNILNNLKLSVERESWATKNFAKGSSLVMTALWQKCQFHFSVVKILSFSRNLIQHYCFGDSHEMRLSSLQMRSSSCTKRDCR